MIYQAGFLKGDNMLADNKLKIEKIYLLKLASLPKRDQRWVIKKLKRHNKSAFKKIMNKLSGAKKFNLSYSDFEYIYEELNFSRLFDKNEIERRIDRLNLLPESIFENLLNDLSLSDLKLFIFCDDALEIKKSIILKIKLSSEYIANKFDLNLKSNKKISDCLINYLYEKFVAGSI